jgi:hypothetical protein
MGSTRVTRQLNILFGFATAALLFQNCTPNHLAVDEDQKNTFLATNKVLTTTSPGTSSKIINFTFVCPQQAGKIKPKDLLQSGDLKAVIEKYDFDNRTTTTFCEVHGIKKQLLDSRSIDLSSCDEIPDSQNAHLDLYIVEESVQKDFSQYKINIDTTPLALGGYTLNYLVMNSDGTDSPVCDEAGAPLMIQLGNQTTALSLTSPTDGVQLDLLGGKSYPNPHDKVYTSWFTPNSAVDVFVLVKPNRDHLVLGADEMFADTTLGPDMKYAKQGFAALEKYDDNKDQLITADDVIFHELRLWKDLNHDGIVQENELSTLQEQKIVALDLRYQTQYREADAYGNQSLYKSIVIMEDQSYGLMFDLSLRFIHKMPPPEKASVPQATTSSLSESSDAEDSSDESELPVPDQSSAAMNSKTSEPHEESPPPESSQALGEPSDSH